MDKQDSVMFELRNINNLIKRKIDSMAKIECIDNMTPLHGWLIGHLYDNIDKCIFQKDIETEFNIRSSTATNVLKLMEKNGFIIRVPSKEDARLKRIILTDKAVEFHKEICENIHKIEDELTEGLTEKELDMFFYIMHKIKKNAIKDEELK